MMVRHPGRLVILTDFGRARGGASKLAMLHAGLMAGRGLPVTVFAGDEGGDEPAGAELVALGARRLLEQGRVAAALGGLWNRAAHSALRDWIAANDRPDTIYHVHGIQQTLSPSVLAPLGAVRHRVVLHAHDYFLACPNGAFFDYRAAATCTRRPLSMACLARNCDKRSRAQKLWRVARQALQDRGAAPLFRDGRVALIHEGMGARLWRDRMAGVRAVVIPNPADRPAELAPDPGSCDEFLYVGDIHAYKGVFLLADAARRAGVRLRFVGEGQDRARLQDAYPEHLFDGWADRAGLARRLMGARALVAPTLGPEPYGLAPVEALLTGVPVILSDGMLLARDITAGGAGAVFPAGDAAALATLLADLARDDARIRSMAAHGPRTAARISLAPGDWGDRLLALYAEMLAEAEGRR
ncbi:glycosyltransferase [Aliigemmobacter aestuarii]|uniref:Glycosyltransferase n=1 Tax=Aliigemmobacter aestuarii TaxID=1445661 RepID=A0A4V3V0G1_9RHOB|nr:glycosyltransferase [Gemmobacter aestuarii]THD83782.1 glycosyltransferase [Gemmobacter aestuarii]